MSLSSVKQSELLPTSVREYLQKHNDLEPCLNRCMNLLLRQQPADPISDLGQKLLEGSSGSSAKFETCRVSEGASAQALQVDVVVSIRGHRAAVLQRLLPKELVRSKQVEDAPDHLTLQEGKDFCEQVLTKAMNGVDILDVALIVDRLENRVGDISAIEAMLVNAAANATSLSISSVVRSIITSAEVFSPTVEEFPDLAFDLVQCPNARVGISGSPALLGIGPQDGQLNVDGLIACAAKMRETLAQDNTIRSDDSCYTATSVAEAVVALKSAADKVSNGAMCVVWINGGISIEQLDELVQYLGNMGEATNFISTIIQTAEGGESDTIAKMKVR
eukprot:GHVS01045485.1.p1 GENE.GHVS01045485.1~~GHVS01045485.1.p1  ORF type:complete len:333 (+),score=48.62 GHVS01045485.1:3-1001(+)